jgi:hypothetical protein
MTYDQKIIIIYDYLVVSIINLNQRLANNKLKN